MKDILKEYYKLDDDIEVLESNLIASFVKKNNKYYFVPFNRSKEELNDLLNLNNEIILKKLPTSKFVPNKDNSYFTSINDKDYVLLEFMMSDTKEYNIIDMINFDRMLVVKNSNSLLYRNNWAALWSEKMDYFEYQVRELGIDKEIILNSFSYYEGLCENAIAYVNSTLKKYKISIYEKITLQRKRINYPNILVNYFNPLNYVIDIEVRDVASYFKSMFFNDYNNLFIEIKAYLKRKKLSIFGYQLLYARLLYPNYYFDIYEKVIENKESEEKLIPIINKAKDYEKFLKDMYNILSEFAPIEKIDWIVDKKES